MAGTNDNDYVVITVADDKAQALEYKSLLKSSEIPAVVREQDDGSVIVMVPEEYLDEAHVLIREQNGYDDLYDVDPDDSDDEDMQDDAYDDDDQY